jgi:GntR family transcriptional regulator/MocR family aminotransferase
MKYDFIHPTVEAGGMCVAADDILWRQLLTLSRRPDLTLQAQLRAAIAQAVLDRRLPPGATLPSSRRLSEILGISRNTVIQAYELLSQEGFISARSRSRPMVDPAALENAARASGARPDPPTRRPDWARRLVSRPSRTRHVTKPVDWYNYRFPFVYGQPDPSLFPITEWREVVQLSLRSVAIRDWAGDHVDADDPLLIEIPTSATCAASSARRSGRWRWMPTGCARAKGWPAAT